MTLIIKETGERKELNYRTGDGRMTANDVMDALDVTCWDGVTQDYDEDAYIVTAEQADRLEEIVPCYIHGTDELASLKHLYDEDEVDSIYNEEMGPTFDIDDFARAVADTRARLEAKYDTSAAREVASNRSDFPQSDFRWSSETLYQRADGSYFIVGEGGSMTRYANRNGDNRIDYGELRYSVTEKKAQAFIAGSKETPEDM